MRSISVLVAALLACSGSGCSDGKPRTPEAPSPGAPSSALPPADCHVEADLPAPGGEPDPGACATASLELGSPTELATTARCPGALGCDFPCGQVAIDGKRTVAWWMATYLGGGGYVRSELRLFDASGAQLALASDRGPLAPGPTGFLAYGWKPTLTRYAASGPLGAVVDPGWPVRLPGTWWWPAAYGGPTAFRADASGGVLVATTGVAADGAAELWVARVAADGQVTIAPFRALAVPPGATTWESDLRASRIQAALARVAIAQDGAGRILVLWSGLGACADATAGRWFAPDGAPLGPVFRAGALPEGDLVPLLDGSLAFRARGGDWPRRFQGGVPAGGPVPEWLAARATETLRQAPGGRLLAALRPACASADRRPRIELVARDGTVCASALLPAQEGCDDPRGQISPATPTLGFDGTLAQFARRVTVGADAMDYRCVFRLFPAALR